MTLTNKVLIIGSGLSGLTLAYLLQKQQIDYIILEASARFGGRIQTQKGKLDTPLELGATWFSREHRQLLSLLEELGLQKYPQSSGGTSLFQTKSFEPPQQFKVPESEDPSFRIKGGTEAVIKALVSKLPSNTLQINTRVHSITENEGLLKVDTESGASFYASKAVLCLPPQLVASGIEFAPALPPDVQQLLSSVQTWMAGSIKFTLEYDQPFWRQKGYSGMLFSHVGIVTEMYDHTNAEGDKFGFTGFLNPAAASYTQKDRKQYVLQQLTELLGSEAGEPVAYFDKIWNDDTILGNNSMIQRPHFNNGHPLLQQTYMKGKLLFSGTETAEQHSGYMEGAVSSANRVLSQLIS